MKSKLIALYFTDKSKNQFKITRDVAIFNVINLTAFSFDPLAIRLHYIQDRDDYTWSITDRLCNCCGEFLLNSSSDFMLYFVVPQASNKWKTLRSTNEVLFKFWSLLGTVRIIFEYSTKLMLKRWIVSSGYSLIGCEYSYCTLIRISIRLLNELTVFS